MAIYVGDTRYTPYIGDTRWRHMSGIKPKEYIVFESQEMEAYCVSKWSSDGIGLTHQDAEAVTTISSAIKSNFPVAPFNELQYFVNLSNAGNALQNSTFTKVTVPSTWSSIPVGCLADCTNLTHVTINNTITAINKQAFIRSTSLISLYINSTTVPTMDTQTLYNTGIYLNIVAPSSYSNPGYIYVPDSVVDTYKSTGSSSSASNWAYYADRIKAISEYPTA